MKSKDLPLHLFDRLFRTAGSLLLFALWGVRAAATRLLPAHFDRASTLLWAPVGIYLGQAAIRVAIYQLHVAGGCCRGGGRDRGHCCRGRRGFHLPCLPFAIALLLQPCPLLLLSCWLAAPGPHPLPAPPAGYIFTPQPQRWARDNLSHPPHVMSDHVLLASAVHGGLVSEALLPLLNWRHAGATGGGGSGGSGSRSWAAPAGVKGRLCLQPASTAPCRICPAPRSSRPRLWPAPCRPLSVAVLTARP